MPELLAKLWNYQLHVIYNPISSRLGSSKEILIEFGAWYISPEIEIETIDHISLFNTYLWKIILYWIIHLVYLLSGKFILVGNFFLLNLYNFHESMK